MNFSAALKLAKSQGYTGPDTLADVQTFLNSLNANFVVKGQTIAAKSLKVTQDSPSQVTIIEVPDEAPAEHAISDAPAVDMASITKSLDSKIEEIAKKHLARLSPVTISGGLPADEAEYNRQPEFTRTGVRRKMFKTGEMSKAFGAWIVGHKLNNEVDAQTRDAARKCFASLDVVKKSLTLTPSSAGVLSGTMFVPELIQLFDEYGVAAASADITNTTEKNVTRAQSTTEILSYGYPNEGSAPTVTDQSFRILNQTLHSLFILCAASRQTLKYSFVDVGNSIASDLVRTGAYAEDQAAFNGDGTATYGLMTGLAGAFSTSAYCGLTLATAAGATNVNPAGTTAGSWADYTIGHFQQLKSLVPAYAKRKFNDCAFYCHHKLYEQVMDPLRLLPGKTFGAGATGADVSGFNADNDPMFLGFPVRFVENMNSTSSTGASTIDCYFGSLSRGMSLARGTNLEVERNDSVGFTSGLINYRGILDHDVNVVHGVGTTSKAGPIACLYQI